MKSKHEDFKWNGILIFGKRYGRYNLLFMYGTACLGLFALFACKSLFNYGIQQFIRSVVIGLTAGLTLSISNLLTYTNVLLIASPQLCKLYLETRKNQIVLIEKQSGCFKFKNTDDNNPFIIIFDSTKNIIWFDKH